MMGMLMTLTTILLTMARAAAPEAGDGISASFVLM
jgi:hypothetical protein